jgi:hypothetical protein
MPFQKQQQQKSNIVLFAEKGTANPNAPTMRGTIELMPAELKWLIEQHRSNKPVKLKVAIWKRIPKSGGNAFLSGNLEPDIPYQRPGDDFPSLETDDITL